MQSLSEIYKALAEWVKEKLDASYTDWEAIYDLLKIMQLIDDYGNNRLDNWRAGL